MPTILVFVKYPEPGRVKTRLASTIGAARACELYRSWVGSVFTALQPLRPTTRVVGYYDGAAREAFQAWETMADDWWAQPAGDLGNRLEQGLRRGLTAGEPALAIGTDCLEIGADLVGSAFAAFQTCDIVFGPTPDGGYYLIGLARDCPGLFRSVRWSSAHTLADHLERCRENDWSFGLLPARHDIDTEEDLAAYLERASQAVARS